MSSTTMRAQKESFKYDQKVSTLRGRTQDGTYRTFLYCERLPATKETW